MKRIYSYYFLLLILFSCKSLAYKDYMLGVESAENLNYSEGISSFLKSWESSPQPETARGLAQAYLKTRNFEQAEEWYARLERDQELDSLDWKPFAEVLIANSKYTEATELLMKLDPNQENPKLASLWKSATQGKEFLNKPTTAQIKGLDQINTSFAEFGPFFSSDSLLYFTSDRLVASSKRIDTQNALKSNVYGWTGNGFLAMYQSPWDSDQNQVKNSPIQDETLKSELHVGPYFQSGNNLFVTLTQPQKFEKSSDKGSARDYTLYPELFFAQKSDTLAVEDFDALPFNQPFSYSVSDAFFDAAENRLYFSSDMPGGMGKADIYYAEWTDNGGWSAPVNLGADINTDQDERTPIIGPDGHFYFSSAGWAGIGGLDVFRAERNGGGLGSPINLGSPVNSNRDDFGFSFLGQDPEQAFLASDRQGGKGLDDIYWVDLNVERTLILQGKVYDLTTKEVLSDAVVNLISDNGNVLGSRITEEDGSFRFKIDPAQLLTLKASKTGFLDGENGNIRIPPSSDIRDSVLTRDVYLDQIEVGKTFRLENIYYDFDKWDIREDARPELDRLAAILEDNPTMQIELHSHTDSRGTTSYNQKLSQKRAQSVVDYLLNLGISSSRLEAVGYGESQLLNSCSDGTSCTEEEHQQNRRTEFKIVAY